MLVPKPYTPYSKEPVLSQTEYRRRMALIEKELKPIDNLKFDRPSYREALWQAILSRGDARTFDLIEELADHRSLGRLLSDHKHTVVRRAMESVDGEPPWRFISSAPSAKSPDTQRLAASRRGAGVTPTDAAGPVCEAPSVR